MRKIVLFILLAGFLTTGFAQNESYSERVSKEDAEYVAKHMKLKKDKTTYIENVLLTKYEYVAKELKAKGEDISQEERKDIYKKSFDKLVADLSQEFSKVEIERINELLKKQSDQRTKA